MNTILKIILGPMFSGKSTELIRLIREYRFIEAKIMVIKHSLDDNRYEKSKIMYPRSSNRRVYKYK